MGDFFLEALKKFTFAIRYNPVGMFIYGIIAKWYILVTISAILVLYWVLKGLQNLGILDAAFQILKNNLNLAKAIAQNCTPKIVHINSFWSCLSDPGIYNNAPGEEQMNNIGEQLQNLINQNSMGKPVKPQNPYLK
jgi:Protein of unknown function (DUF2670)